MCLHDGSGVPRDKTEAYRWFVRSAEQGYPYAQYMLGRYLEEGWAGPKDLDAAATWYERASRQGNSHAKTALERVQSLLKARPATPAPAPSQPEAPVTPGTSTPDTNQEDEVNRLLAELDALTGLKAVKREIRRRVASVRLSRLRGDTGGHGSLHMVFSGSPGTGKTTVARLVGRIYQALGLITDGDRFVECGRQDLVGSHIGETALQVNEQVDRALGGILFIDEAYSLYVPDSDRDFGSEAIDTLVKAMEDHRDDLVVIMAGYTDEMRTMIRDANPGLASRFRTWVEFEDYTPDELLKIAQKMLSDRDREMGPGVEEALLEVIRSRCRDGGFGNARGVRNLLDDIQDVMDERLSDRILSGSRLGSDELRQIARSDVEQLMRQSSGGERQPESLDDLLAELDSLTGLASAKQSVRIRVAQAKLSALAKESNVPIMTDATSLHMVFTGSPGTGKTTVARLVGRIYHALGIVRDADRFVECRREDLVGTHVGQTAPKVRAQVQRALGGILFIDEAYSLYAPHSDNDFGTEAIDTLVALMENHRDDLVVIMAGYTNEMHAMIEGANPGLKSRFRTWVMFEDYTDDELIRIFESMAAARKLQLDDGCRDKVAEVIAARNAAGNFGNARGVRNLLDDTVERMVLRLSEEGDAARRRGQRLSREEFSTIREVDIPPVPKGPTKPRKYRMGFS